MSIDIGPFQEIVGISFPQENPEDFEHGEPMLARDNGCDPATETALGTFVSRVPTSGTLSRGCICKNPIFSGAETYFTLLIRIPLSADWPDCVIGGNSGAKLFSEYWPEEPAGWGGGSPAPFSDPPAGFCYIPFSQSGNVVAGSQYQITSTWQVTCTPHASEPECCG